MKQSLRRLSPDSECVLGENRGVRWVIIALSKSKVRKWRCAGMREPGGFGVNGVSKHPHKDLYSGVHSSFIYSSSKGNPPNMHPQVKE